MNTWYNVNRVRLKTNNINTMKTRTPKYNLELKRKAGQMSVDGMSVKQIAKELGVTFNVANYLEYTGKKILGADIIHRRNFWPKKYSPRSTRAPFDMENEIYQKRSGMPITAKVTIWMAVIVIAIATMSPFINKIVSAWADKN